MSKLPALTSALPKLTSFDNDLFDVEREHALLQEMVQKGPLVDGVTGLPTATVDGLEFSRYAEVLGKLSTACGFAR